MINSLGLHCECHGSVIDDQWGSEYIDGYTLVDGQCLAHLASGSFESLRKSGGVSGLVGAQAGHVKGQRGERCGIDRTFLVQHILSDYRDELGDHRWFTGIQIDGVGPADGEYIGWR